jgi:hypothetical protein
VGGGERDLWFSFALKHKIERLRNTEVDDKFDAE